MPFDAAASASRDDCFRLLKDMLQVIRSPEAFRIDLVDIFSAGRARCEPAIFGDYLNAADRRVISGRAREDSPDFLTCQVRAIDLLGRQFRQNSFFRRGGGRVNALEYRMRQIRAQAHGISRRDRG